MNMMMTMKKRLLRQNGGATALPVVAGIPSELHLLLKVLSQCGKIILKINWILICG
jgi:hypothetical protein